MLTTVQLEAAPSLTRHLGEGYHHVKMVIALLFDGEMTGNETTWRQTINWSSRTSSGITSAGCSQALFGTFAELHPT